MFRHLLGYSPRLIIKSSFHPHNVQHADFCIVLPEPACVESIWVPFRNFLCGVLQFWKKYMSLAKYLFQKSVFWGIQHWFCCKSLLGYWDTIFAESEYPADRTTVPRVILSERLVYKISTSAPNSPRINTVGVWNCSLASGGCRYLDLSKNLKLVVAICGPHQVILRLS